MIVAQSWWNSLLTCYKGVIWCLKKGGGRSHGLPTTLLSPARLAGSSRPDERSGFGDRAWYLKTYRKVTNRLKTRELEVHAYTHQILPVSESLF